MSSQVYDLVNLIKGQEFPTQIPKMIEDCYDPQKSCSYHRLFSLSAPESSYESFYGEDADAYKDYMKTVDAYYDSYDPATVSRDELTSKWSEFESIEGPMHAARCAKKYPGSVPKIGMCCLASLKGKYTNPNKATIDDYDFCMNQQYQLPGERVENMFECPRICGKDDVEGALGLIDLIGTDDDKASQSNIQVSEEGQVLDKIVVNKYTTVHKTDQPASKNSGDDETMIWVVVGVFGCLFLLMIVGFVIMML